LLDGAGFEYPATLTAVGKDSVEVSLGERRPGRSEPVVHVRLYLSLLNKPDKFEWALQKCTELGVSEIVPLEASRSVSGGPSSESRYERWERIVREAAEQSGRCRLPVMARSTSFSDVVREESVCSRSRSGHLALFPTLEAATSLKAVLSAERANSVSIFIGPEGGFTPAEVDTARNSGLCPVTLGPRTLRAETAAVAALTMIMYELGDLDVPAHGE
jgi:16S rRNA (uracil1498-N3)-methyltransferase